MARFKQLPWLSLSFLLLSCSIVDSFLLGLIPGWSIWLLKLGQSLGWSFSEAIVSQLLTFLVVGLSLFVVIAFTTPIAVMRLLMGRWLESDQKTLSTALVWTLIIVVLFCWIEHFVHFLLLLASAVLARLDLQTAGYNEWQMLIILALTCMLSFGLGWLTFTFFGYTP